MRYVAASLAFIVAASGSSLTAQDGPRPAAQPAAITRDALAEQLRLLGQERDAPRVTSADAVVIGGRVVEGGVVESGNVTVARGDLTVIGTIHGDAVAIDGDVIVRNGGQVLGSAWAVRGRVRVEDGGHVQGEMRALAGPLGAARAAAELSPTTATRRALALAAAWLAILMIIGIGVLLSASAYLDGVTDSLESNFATSFWTGVVGQLAILPAVVLLVVALAITILGILLIPFAVVAFALAVAGMITLGFLAVAQVTGRSLFGSSMAGRSPRGAALRALIFGVIVYLAIWMVAALFTWLPVVAASLRYLALVVTWVAATAGLGAVIRSRAGTRREPVAAERGGVPAELMWQTPTPVAGVVAARRPTPAPPSSVER